MANIIHTMKTTRATLKSPPTDCTRAETIVFIPELCEMNLSGRRVRNSLRILITGRLIYSKDVSIIEMITIKKSI
jgi:hypothetical protein